MPVLSCYRVRTPPAIGIRERTNSVCGAASVRGRAGDGSVAAEIPVYPDASRWVDTGPDAADL